MLRSLRVFPAAALLAAVLASCGDSTGSGGGGEHGGGKAPGLVRLGVDTAVTGTITAADSVRWYAVRGPFAASLGVRLRLQATSGQPGDSVVAVLADSAGTPLGFGATGSTGADSVPRDGDPFSVPDGRLLKVAVRAWPGRHGGPYRLELFAPNPAPETHAAAIAVGETVQDEAIDVPGDVDEFTFTLAQRQTVVLFVQGQSGSAAHRFNALLLNAAGAFVANAVAAGDTPDLESQSSGRLTLGPGAYTLRVKGEGDTRGRYRVRLYGVNPLPEGVPATVLVGDTTRAEAVDDVGDVDEYVFAGAAGESVVAFLQPLTGLSKGLDLKLLRGAEVIASAHADGPAANLDSVWAGPLVLPVSGSYTVQVSGADAGPRAGAAGTYRFELYRVNRQPEHAPAAIAFGSTVASEAVDRAGDVDDFTLTVPAGTRMGLSLTTQPRRADLFLELVAPSGRDVAILTPDGQAGAPGTRFAASEPLLLDPGTYRLTVQSLSGAGGWGPYQVRTYTLDERPEKAPAATAVGATITGESIDRPGDSDVFTFSGTRGQMFTLVLRSLTGRGMLAAFEESTPGYLAGVSTGDTDPHSGVRVVIDSTGTFRVRVDDGGSPPRYLAAPAAYTLTLRPVNPAPETAPAAYTVGDTVRTEKIDVVGDVDEFTFHANAGDALGIRFDMAGPMWVFTCMVLDDAGNTVTGVMANHAPELGWFQAPRTGTYRVRIASGLDKYNGSWVNQDNEKGPYTFSIYRR